MKKKQRAPQTTKTRKAGAGEVAANLDRRSFVKLLPAAGAAGLAVSGLPLKAIAQTPTPTDSLRDNLPRVFLDCQANGCDDDFMRTELTWMNFDFVRNSLTLCAPQ